jgi:hypothetical protein
MHGRDLLTHLDRRRFTERFGWLLMLLALLLPGMAGCPQQACSVPDNGMGTADLPPTCGAGFIGPIGATVITDGLPAGSTIELEDATILNLLRQPIQPGGMLGGDWQHSDAQVALTLRGTGALLGFHRVVVMPIQLEIHAGVRPYGAPVQDFPAVLWHLHGLVLGDPDFDLLKISAGDAIGLPSPGQVKLTEMPGGGYEVDSFFDVTHRIEYQGGPGGALGGMSGWEITSRHLQIGQPTQPPTPADVCPPADMNLDRRVDAADLPGFIDAIVTGPAHPRFCSADANANGIADSADIDRMLTALLTWPTPVVVGTDYWGVEAACDNRRKIIVACVAGDPSTVHRAIRAADTDGNPSTCPVKFQLRTCDGVDVGPVTTLDGGATGCATVPPDRELAVWCEKTPGGECRISAKSTTPCQ